MKKKFMALFLAAVTVTSVLAGCGGSGNSGTTAAEGETTDTASPEAGAETEAVTEAGTETTAEGESASAAEVNEDGTVNNPEDVTADGDKLMFWSIFSGGDGDFMDQIIADYNGKTQEKQVQSIMLVWDDYYTKLQTSVATGKGPDIGVAHTSKLPELVEAGVVEPIDDYLNELGIDMSAMYSENSLASVQFDGQTYAVPLDTHAEILYYNKDILEEAGVELNAEGELEITGKDQFLEILDKVKGVMGDGESPIAMGNGGDDPYRIWWTSYFQMGGTPLISEDGTEATMDKDVALKATEFVKSLYDDGYVLRGIEDHVNLFTGGKAGFMMGGTWLTGTLEKVEGLNFGAMPLPKWFDNDACWADSHTLVLPVKEGRSEEDTKAAVNFIVSASKDGGLIWAESGQIPASLDVINSPEYAALPYRSEYASALQTAVLPPKSPAFGAIKNETVESLDAVWTDSAEPADAVDAIYESIQSNLN